MKPAVPLAENARSQTRRSYGTNSLPFACGVVDPKTPFLQRASAPARNADDQQRRGWTVMRRMLGSAAMLSLFAMGVSMANSRQATGASSPLGESFTEVRGVQCALFTSCWRSNFFARYGDWK